jgi:hypothetical protein
MIGLLVGLMAVTARQFDCAQSIFHVAQISIARNPVAVPRRSIVRNMSSA